MARAGVSGAYSRRIHLHSALAAVKGAGPFLLACPFLQAASRTARHVLSLDV